MKRFLQVVVVLVVVVVSALGAAYFFLDSIVQSTVKSATTATTGTQTSLGRVGLNPFGGSANLGGFAIENPEGFSDSSLFAFDNADVQVEVGSLLGDTIRVPRFEVDGAQVLVEYADGKLNVMELLDRVQGEAPPTDESEDVDPDAATKKVIIDRLAITNTTVLGSVKIPGLEQALQLNFTIPDIVKEDIGSDGTGVTARDAVQIVLETVLVNVGKGMGNAVPNLDAVLGDATAKLDQKVDEFTGQAEQAVREQTEAVEQKLDDTLGKIEKGLGLFGGKRDNADSDNE